MKLHREISILQEKIIAQRLSYDNRNQNTSSFQPTITQGSGSATNGNSSIWSYIGLGGGAGGGGVANNQRTDRYE